MSIRIVTKKGDGGETGLFNGERVRKCDDLIEVVGEIDELQSFLGCARVIAKGTEAGEQILQVQDELYTMMAYFGNGCEWLGDGQLAISNFQLSIGRIERWIDELSEDLDLREFVRPGENELEARLQVCRAVCRRVERRVGQLTISNEQLTIDGVVLRYLNRLSDWLFVRAMNGDNTMA